MMMNNPMDMALMFYVADVRKVFDKLDEKIVERLAFEISALSLTIDITHPTNAYKGGEMELAVARAKDWNKGKKLTMLRPNKDNTFAIVIGKKTFKKNVTPIYLMALMTYLVDKKTNGQLIKQEGFEYLKLGKVI